ncbi:MAG: cytochrome c oxidase accessory protein CcoG [Verrucomicrobia bacterium]|nr:cytochrome c oxidase accessory protein CcoG [Verrucomicrobiota bacterium]
MTQPPPANEHPPADPSPPPSVAQEINWEDYRDHLATADKEGHRRWLFPRKPSGTWHQRRLWLSWILLAVMFAGPFITIEGNPLLMINIVERRFSILGRIFWPQDAVLFAVAMLVFLTGIILFTTAFGRLWCGWTCPQTVLMEMVLRKIEYAIEGDAAAQRQLAESPWNREKILKRTAKHGVFLALSFLIGNTLLAYIIGLDALVRIVTDPPSQHLTGLAFMTLFTLLFYSIFARFREQACIFICPYGRFQSTILDENTLVVAYDHRRGEKRAHLKPSQNAAERATSGLGDCVDCRACIAVCPTGIDIRNGTQMECVNCTACIDACDHIMDKTGRPRGLVRLSSLNNIERQLPQRFTPRMGVYAAVLVALIGLFLFLVLTRADTQTTILRATGSLPQFSAQGQVDNLFTVKILNKTNRDIPVEFRLEQPAGTLRLMSGSPLRVPATKLAQSSPLIELDRGQLSGHSTPVRIGVFGTSGRKLETINTKFLGPRS